MNPIYGAQAMEAAERKHGAYIGDSCLTCHHLQHAFGRDVCMNSNVTAEISRDQFHKCVKKGNFWRASDGN